MPTLSDEDFDQVATQLERTTIGQALVRDYVPITHKVKDADGKDVDGDPTGENAFVISIEQRPETGTHLAHTRIDIRGPDGLIHTSYERDHVQFEDLAEDHAGHELLADTVHVVKVVTMKKVVTNRDEVAAGLDSGVVVEEQYEQVSAERHEIRVLFPKGTVVTPELIDVMRDRGVTKIATRS